MIAPDKAETLEATRILFEPGHVIELRILGANDRFGTSSGYFDNFERLTDARYVHMERKEYMSSLIR